MNQRRTSRGIARRHVSWALFCVFSIVVLGACVVAALETGDRSSVAPALIGGLIVVGLAAALMGSFLSPLPEPSVGLGGTGGLGGVGGFDGGSGGSGGCDGGGGGGC